jgi:hypothetical protein
MSQIAYDNESDNESNFDEIEQAIEEADEEAFLKAVEEVEKQLDSLEAEFEQDSLGMFTSDYETTGHPDVWFPKYAREPCCNGYINICRIGHPPVVVQTKICSVIPQVNTVATTANVACHAKQAGSTVPRCRNGTNCPFLRTKNGCRFGH